MSYIVEEIQHPELGIELQVLEKERGEMFEPYEICSLESDSHRRYTPDEIIDLGLWLIELGKRLKNEYTSTGKKRR